jgi:hypothetical protein
VAKKQRCPKCGAQKFGDFEQVRQCSDCGAVGWLGGGPTNHDRPGATCKWCDTRTMKLVATIPGTEVEVRHCFSCSSTYFL